MQHYKALHKHKTIYSRQFQKVQYKTNSEYEHLAVLKCKTKTRFK